MSKLVFEQKTSRNGEVRDFYWNIFKFYLLLVGGLYLIFVLPAEARSSSGEFVFTTKITFEMIQKSMFLLMAFTLHMVPAKEQARTGVADKLMKIYIATMLVAVNILGIILCALAWNEMPKSLTEEQSLQMAEPRFKLKQEWLVGIAIIAFVVVAGTSFGLWRIHS